MPEFRSLASILLESVNLVRDVVEPVAATADVEIADESSRALPDEAALYEVRLFRAHLREALDRAVDLLRERLAREILARELFLAPAEIAVLVADALADYEQTNPLRVRVHPDDVATLSCTDLPVFADAALARGDAFLDLRQGCVDLRLASRLDDLLATAARP